MSETNTDIEKYQNDPLYAYLTKKVITLPGRPPYVPQRTILIMESCGLVSVRVGNFKARVLGLQLEAEIKENLDKLYAPLAGCSFGDIPAPEEFLAMHNEDIYLWVQEARVIAPDYFEWLNAAEKLVEELSEEDLKKKVNQQQTSALG